MPIIEIFEKVNLVTPIEQRRFFNYFEDTVNELMAMYDGFVTEKNVSYSAPKSLMDDNVVLPLYYGAIVDNIIFLENGEEARKNEFIRKSRSAYLRYWNENAKCRKLKGAGW